MVAVRFQVLTAVSIKMTAFMDIAPCNLIEVADVSEVRTASIIRAVTRPHGVIFQKAVFFLMVVSCDIYPSV
jgi:hypothetical protein